VDGNGTIAGPNGGEADFSLGARLLMTKKKTKVIGGVSYDDPITPLSFHSTKVTSLTFNGNQAHLVGIGQIGKTKLGFTVDAIDNGSPGTNDFFSIHLSNGYSASGKLLTGDISIH
jgi:hypothetical protein